MSGLRNTVVIAGVGYSDLGRDLGRSENSLTLESIRAALDDAGLTAADVDGLTPWPDRQGDNVAAGPKLSVIHRALGMKLRFWQAGSFAGPAQMAGLMAGAHAIAAGAADVVLAWRTVIAQPRATKVRERAHAGPVWHEDAFLASHGARSMAPKWAMMAQRFLYETNQTPEALRAVVLNNRDNAQHNPRAVWHGSPLTAEDYEASPMIASPLRILDCDMPIDASVAIVLARADRAPDLRHPPAYIEAMSGAPGPSTEPDLVGDLTRDVTHWVSRDLWRMTALGPADLDVAELYDGFSFQALMWLEGLGICDAGASGDFLAQGNGRLDGSLPVCTDGGQLGCGRYHGLEKAAAAARQIWGGAGPTQVDGVELAVATAGGGAQGAALLLSAGG